MNSYGSYIGTERNTSMSLPGSGNCAALRHLRIRKEQPPPEQAVVGDDPLAAPGDQPSGKNFRQIQTHMGLFFRVDQHNPVRFDQPAVTLADGFQPQALWPSVFVAHIRDPVGQNVSPFLLGRVQGPAHPVANGQKASHTFGAHGLKCHPLPPLRKSGLPREERLEVLEKKIEEFGLNKEDYWWYLEFRKYGGVVHSGYGLGFERIIMYITGMGNIRDVLPFPRTPRTAEF